MGTVKLSETKLTFFQRPITAFGPHFQWSISDWLPSDNVGICYYRRMRNKAAKLMRSLPSLTWIWKKCDPNHWIPTQIRFNPEPCRFSIGFFTSANAKTTNATEEGTKKKTHRNKSAASARNDNWCLNFVDARMRNGKCMFGETNEERRSKQTKKKKMGKTESPRPKEQRAKNTYFKWIFLLSCLFSRFIYQIHFLFGWTVYFDAKRDSVCQKKNKKKQKTKTRSNGNTHYTWKEHETGAGNKNTQSQQRKRKAKNTGRGKVPGKTGGGRGGEGACGKSIAQDIWIFQWFVECALAAHLVSCRYRLCSRLCQAIWK